MPLVKLVFLLALLDLLTFLIDDKMLELKEQPGSGSDLTELLDISV